ETSQWMPDMRLPGNRNFLHLLANGRSGTYIQTRRLYPRPASDLVTLLVEEYGLDPNEKNDQGETPLLQLCRTMFDHHWQLDLNYVDRDGLDLVKERLIAVGASTILEGTDGASPQLLMDAVEGNPEAIDAYLVARAESEEELERLRHETLWSATRKANLEVMKKLLNLGANPDKSLHCVLRWRDREDPITTMMALLVSHGAQLPPASEQAHYLRMIQYPVVVRQWVKMEGRMDPDPLLFTSKYYGSRSEAVMRELVAHGIPVPNPSEPFESEDFSTYQEWIGAVLTSDPHCLNFLLRDGHLSADYRTPVKQWTLLHLLASGHKRERREFRYGNEVLVPLLVKEYNLDPKASDEYGNTPLHLLHMAAVLTKDTDPSQFGNRGKCMRREQWQEMVDALISQGAENDLRNKNGLTVSDLKAAAEGNPEAWEKVNPYLSQWPILAETGGAPDHSAN
ncbi:MAG: hypothetical protein AAF191_12475, partial [Verrucomicrobiota bacterium]